MSAASETFFTVVGCMDGRIQEPVAAFGREKFGAKFADTITEAGIVGLIANNPEPKFIENLKFKLLVSVEKHHSKGIVVDSHQECSGNPVEDEQHKQDIKASVDFVRNLIENKVPVLGVFVQRESDGWKAEEV
jgi:hypothetical protein